MMKPKEACRILNQYDVSAISMCWTDGEEIPHEEWMDAFETAIEALKKQTPEKPVEGYVFSEDFRKRIIARDGEHNPILKRKGDCCPGCGHYIGKTVYEIEVFGRAGRPFCPWCGQAIDWSAE